MDEERHKYKINSFVNITNPFSTQLYPQFIIEGVLKEALGDDDFEFKLRSTPMPAPFENTEKGNYLTAEDHFWTEVLITMSAVTAKWVSLSIQANGAVVLAWLVLNLVTVTQLIRDRKS